MEESSLLREILEKHLRGTDEQMENAQYEILQYFNKICPTCNSWKTLMANDTPMVCNECGQVYFESIKK